MCYDYSFCNRLVIAGNCAILFDMIPDDLEKWANELEKADKNRGLLDFELEREKGRGAWQVENRIEQDLDEWLEEQIS